jgi:DNA mismatch repair protein MutH
MRKVYTAKVKNLHHVAPPENFSELEGRLRFITGRTLGEICSSLKVSVPESTVHAKGFAGELIEAVLGTDADNAPEPDFTKLGLELKSVPVDQNFKPLESTFLCHVPLMGSRGQRFEDSALYKKVHRILLVFVLAPRDLEMAQRKILGYIFWEPTSDDLKTIKGDYDELMEMIETGGIGEITARIGAIVQLRPKGANGRELTECIGPEGSIIKTRPRGFYMRRSFMQEIIRRARAPK